MVSFCPVSFCHSQKKCVCWIVSARGYWNARVAMPRFGLTICGLPVNLSPNQVVHTDIVATVRDMLSVANLPGNRLELEVTESVIPWQQ